MTSRRIRISYEVVTPESAEDGEAAESGWVDEDGAEIGLDAFDLENEMTHAEKAAEFILDSVGGNLEPSSWPSWSRGTWYTDYDYDIDYSTAAVESRSYHLEGFTESEEKEIFKLLLGK